MTWLRKPDWLVKHRAMRLSEAMGETRSSRCLIWVAVEGQTRRTLEWVEDGRQRESVCVCL